MSRTRGALLVALLAANSPAWAQPVPVPAPVSSVPVPTAPEGDPPPLTPRYPTPSEAEADAARPPFERPPAATETAPTPPTPAAAAAARAARLRTIYQPPALLGHSQGSRRTWLGEALLARPRELGRVGQTLAEAKANAGRGVLYARGFYSYVTDGHAEWSGTDLVAYADLADGFSGSASYHHEYREERGGLGLASLAVRIAPEMHVTSTVGAGNGVDYLPITTLALELSAPVPRTCKVRYGVAAGTSWWAHEQRDLTLGGSLRALLPANLVAELRGDVTVVNAPDDDAHLGLRGTATVARGRHGAHIWQARVAVGDEPAYAPGLPLAMRDDRLTVDASVGVRGWLRRRYGYLVQLEGGHQAHGFSRIGGDLTVFFEF